MIRIYNLFPRYYKNINHWRLEFDHISQLGFNTIYINPIHYPGFSGSLYAPKNYYTINPLFVDSADSSTPLEQLSDFLNDAHNKNIKVVMDLVINHSSKDNPLTSDHPSWYAYDKNGNINSPGAWEDGKWICWGDLAQFDHMQSEDKEQLQKYFEDLIIYYLELGFDGFRADAAYQIPSHLWAYLINIAKKIKPDVIFIAESLGCTADKIHSLSQSGFDFLFNSAKWWDFEENWFIDQYNMVDDSCYMISFPESHDTLRIAKEYDNNINKIKRLVAFTGLISPTWMIITGTEFCWKEKPDVCRTLPKNIEDINIDLEEFITDINKLRDRFPIFNDKGTLSIVDHLDDENVLILEKKSLRTDEMITFIINKTNNIQKINYDKIKNQTNIFSSCNDITINTSDISLLEYELKIFVHGLS